MKEKEDEGGDDGGDAAKVRVSQFSFEYIHVLERAATSSFV